MKRIISFLFLGIASASYAQHGGVMPMASFTIGASFQKFDGLNSRIKGLPQYDQLKDHAGTIGIGWLKEHNRVISNANLTLGSSMSGHNDEKSSTIRYYSISADIGYDLLKSENLMLYPLAGIGFQKYQAIFYKDYSTVPFDDVLESTEVQNSIKSVRFNNPFFVYRLGLGFNVKSSKHPSCSIGVQGGYTGSFITNSWKSSENRALGNSPQDKVSQFFVGLVFTSSPMFMK